VDNNYFVVDLTIPSPMLVQTLYTLSAASRQHCVGIRTKETNPFIGSLSNKLFGPTVNATTLIEGLQTLLIIGLPGKWHVFTDQNLPILAATPHITVRPINPGSAL